ncbi:NAD-P-binding protein [Auriscalpium vulgare]|uniref:NAD-P-binding protein n=1 Tax=Auriscalpium vulgare TaxID=40419 RepID=A0ACB8RUK7_9AGAM|nr:NAD-P-binding protein [Auriscalpium vulgare]
MSILIIPAASRTNTFVIEALLSSPHSSSVPLKLLAHTPASQARLQSAYKDHANVSVIAGDFTDRAALDAAMHGVRAIFYNAPVMAGEVQAGKGVVDAAVAARVERFVYCSVLHPYISQLVHHRNKLEVEEYLFESDLNYTILQPTHLMQNIAVAQIATSGRLTIPYAPAIPHGFLDLADLGVVAAAALLAPATHSRARYELVGENATYADVARALSAAAGKEVEVEVSDKDTALQGMRDKGIVRDDYGRDALGRMMKYYDERGLPGNTNILRWLLGREPTSLKAYIAEELSAVKQ